MSLWIWSWINTFSHPGAFTPLKLIKLSLLSSSAYWERHIFPILSGRSNSFPSWSPGKQICPPKFWRCSNVSLSYQASSSECCFFSLFYWAKTPWSFFSLFLPRWFNYFSATLLPGWGSSMHILKHSHRSRLQKRFCRGWWRRRIGWGKFDLELHYWNFCPQEDCWGRKLRIY